MSAPLECRRLSTRTWRTVDLACFTTDVALESRSQRGLCYIVRVATIGECRRAGHIPSPGALAPDVCTAHAYGRVCTHERAALLVDALAQTAAWRADCAHSWTGYLAADARLERLTGELQALGYRVATPGPSDPGWASAA